MNNDQQDIVKAFEQVGAIPDTCGKVSQWYRFSTGKLARPPVTAEHCESCSLCASNFSQWMEVIAEADAPHPAKYLSREGADFYTWMSTVENVLGSIGDFVREPVERLLGSRTPALAFKSASSTTSREDAKLFGKVWSTAGLDVKVRSSQEPTDRVRLAIHSGELPPGTMVRLRVVDVANSSPSDHLRLLRQPLQSGTGAAFISIDPPSTTGCHLIPSVVDVNEQSRLDPDLLWESYQSSCRDDGAAFDQWKTWSQQALQRECDDFLLQEKLQRIANAEQPKKSTVFTSIPTEIVHGRRDRAVCLLKSDPIGPNDVRTTQCVDAA